MQTRPTNVLAAFIAGVLAIFAMLFGATLGLSLAYSDALGQTKPTACYTIEDQLLLTANMAGENRTTVKVFVWTSPRDERFKAVYTLAKDSPGVFGFSIFYAGCSQPLPNGLAYDMVKINPTALRNIASSELIYDTGDVGLPEADALGKKSY